MLSSEGVEFDVSARALPVGRLTADNLQSMLGWFDPDDDVPDDIHTGAGS